MRDCNHGIWFADLGKVEIRSGDIPSPGPGQALIRTRKTLISSGTEIALLHHPASAGSAWSDFARFPRPVGYSNVGDVVRVGAGVEPSLTGALVASRGSHAAWVVRDVTDLRLLPRGVSEEDATFTTLACVAMHGLRRIRLTWGESVAVFGLGLVGQLCVRLAAVAGASIVCGLEPSDVRLGRLPAQPPTVALTGGLEAALAAVREMTDGLGVDVVIEATGLANLIPSEIGFLRDQGRLLVLSSPRSATTFDFHDFCNRRSVTIVGAHGFSQSRTPAPDNPWTIQRHGDLFLALVASGRLSVGELVTHRFHYAGAHDAYALLSERPGDAMAVVLDWL
jgi:threonine dehydrogenase-like Zn-dependent dehydrogenase